MSTVTLQHFLAIGAVLFSLGMVGVITRRNAIAVLIGIELMLNAAGLNLVAFARYGQSGIDGSIFALFVIVLAAAEAVVALALILAIQRRLKTVDVDRTDSLRG